MPFLVRWPGRVKPGVSAALMSQVDFFASFAALAGKRARGRAGPDSFNVLPALLGESKNGRDHVVEQAGALSLVRGSWKLIAPERRSALRAGTTSTELGNDPRPQLYDLTADLGETRNVAAEHPEVVRQLSEELARIRRAGRSRPSQ